MHDHHCLHASLGYCATCDVAFCRGCKREWGGHVHVSTWPGWSPYYQPTWVYTSTSGAEGTMTTTASAVACAGHN